MTSPRAVRWLTVAVLAVLGLPDVGHAAACRFPGAAVTCPAPTGPATIIWREADPAKGGRHALLVREPRTPDRVVHEFDRAVEVLWSPRGYELAITDHHASGESTVWVLWGPRLTERANLAEDPAVGRAFPKAGRRRLVALEWDSYTLRVAVARPLTDPPSHIARFTYEVGREAVPEEGEGPPVAGLLGLLELPGVLPDGNSCSPDAPVSVDVYRRTADRRAAGAISGEAATRAADGSCITGRGHAGFAGGMTAPLPTLDHGYEAAAAIVVERRPGWYRILLPEGTGWVRAAAQRTFHPLLELIREGLSHLSGDWDGLFRSSPGGAATRPPGTSADTNVRVLRVRHHAGRDWLLVETYEPCGDLPKESDEPHRIRGWVPLYNDDRRPTIWFYSRGC